MEVSTIAVTTPEDLKELAVCFSLTLGRFSLNRKVRTDQVTVDADEDRIGVRKRILNSESYQAIQRLDATIRNYLVCRALPSLLRKGIYLLPLNQVENIETAMAQFQEERQLLIEKFLASYDESIEEAKKSLRTLFNVWDYPSVERVRQSFTMTYRLFSAEVPESLANISSLVYDREKERAKEFWADSKLLIEETLTSEFSGLVDHLVDRLQVEPGDKQKIFKNSLLTNFDEWVALYETRDITNNVKLKEQVEKARKVLKSVNPDDLRKDLRVREEIQKSFVEIKETTQSWMIDQPSRMMELD